MFVQVQNYCKIYDNGKQAISLDLRQLNILTYEVSNLFLQKK